MLNKFVDTQLNIVETGIKSAIKYVPYEVTRKGMENFYSAGFDFTRSIIDSTDQYTRSLMAAFQPTK